MKRWTERNDIGYLILTSLCNNAKHPSWCLFNSWIYVVDEHQLIHTESRILTEISHTMFKRWPEGKKWQILNRTYLYVSVEHWNTSISAVEQSGSQQQLASHAFPVKSHEHIPAVNIILLAGVRTFINNKYSTACNSHDTYQLEPVQILKWNIEVERFRWISI